MSEKYLCIGGFFDGEWHEPNMGKGRLELHEPLAPISVSRDLDFNEELGPINRHVYELKEYRYQPTMKDTPQSLFYWTAADVSPLHALKLLMQNYKPIKPVTERDLQSMMRDPKYWRDQDPSFVQKVTEGFQKLYGRK